MKIVWFRSDLRVNDNPALYMASNNSEEQIRGVFFITPKQWLAHNWGENKIGFVIANILKLQEELIKLNINLDIIECPDFKSVPFELFKYANHHKCSSLYFNKEYELNETIRDNNVIKQASQFGIQCHVFDDQCLIAPGTILTKQHTPYTIFTAFKNSYYKYLEINRISLASKPSKQPTTNFKPSKLNINEIYLKHLNNKVVKKWSPGEQYAKSLLKKFCSDSIFEYKKARDFPALDGTSSLSAYLAVGAISARQCFSAALNQNNYELTSGDENIRCWIDELIWRDFYRNIIFHYPNICKGHNFNKKYDSIAWLAPKHELTKWKNGQTGVPIIDAAMRQLVDTGWMHNRLRMITAIFLTKNLLIDWRHGEQFFSQHLIDLDFASNNGGWQWSASTGTDAVPYFRIFNPITQSMKFDPHGKFILKYCPELTNLSIKDLHNPSNKLNDDELKQINYPRIIIDLNQSRKRALEAFTQIIPLTN